MGGGAEILELLASEDVDGDQVDLGVTVLAGLGGRHVDDLARTVLDHDVATLTQSRALHGVGGGRTSIDGVEGVLMLLYSGSLRLASNASLMIVDAGYCDERSGKDNDAIRTRCVGRAKGHSPVEGPHHGRSERGCAMSDAG